MRHAFARSLSAVLMFVALLPGSFLGQNQNSEKPALSSDKTVPEIGLLKRDEGPAMSVDGGIPKGRLAPGLPSPAGEASPQPVVAPTFRVMSHPREGRLRRGHSFDNDLRTLPQVAPEKFERPEVEEPQIIPVPYPGTSSRMSATATTPISGTLAPPPSQGFEGLDFANWGAGHPPDTNGDVGPLYYIQTINTSVGIYNKSDGSQVTAFTFNALMSQGNFGNLCDTANFGDPVVLYDTFEDRWIITDFAFNLSGGVVVTPEFQCFAVSKSGDPVAGGWNFYSIQVSGGYGDYPKFGIWPDGLYVSANIFSFGAASTFQNVRVWALNKAQMYAGNPTVQMLSFDAPSVEFTLLPSNARLQTGTPPAGSTNYFAVVAQYLNVVSVYGLHADWNNISTSTFSGPFLSLTGTSWSQLLSANQSEQSPGNKLDTLYPRLMMQNQYTNIGGVESLWNSHTVGAAGASSAQSAVRYYQVKVTGGTVEANATQAYTYSPDATVFRFTPSVAVDRAGDMAIGYSATNATLNPAIRYAGRLAGDPANSISQTEQSLLEGTGTQSGSCGTTCTRWGDYSAMTLDQDGCTFWYTNLYYQTNGLAFNTRIGAFSFPGCTPAVSGALQGTVTDAGSSNPMSGVTVALGSRTTTTADNGTYSFAGLPSGTYPSITASLPGYNSITVADIVINDGSTATQDFSLTTAPTSACLTDTTQADFQGGIPTNCDLTTSSGDVTLLSAANIDQQNPTVTNNGFGFTSSSWAGQTFKAGVTGQLTRADVDWFCSGCTGTTPNLTVSIRATTGTPPVPAGADLATATVTGFSSNSGGYLTANFSSPPTLTAGTTYAVIFRAASNPSAGIYAYVCSCTAPNSNPYADGQRVTSVNSGLNWVADVNSGGRDIGFKIYMQSGFASLGTFVSSTKDANPAPNVTATWSMLSWNAATPAGTAIQFQAAASNSVAGPFNFVGPDGTAATFFSNGGSLAQFNGNRYLKYQASLSTTSSAITPTLEDVTVCLIDAPDTTLVVAAATGPFGGTSDLSATLNAQGLGVSGKSVVFMLNGSAAGSGVTNGSGTATAFSVSLTGMNAGSYSGVVSATFAGDSGFGPSSGLGDLTVFKADQAITFAGLGNKVFGDADFSVSATASSTLSVTFSATGTCTLAGSTVHLTGAGSCTITASQAGDSNYNPAPDVPQSFTIAKTDQTITFGALSGKNFGDPDFAISATASSNLAVAFSATGSCSVAGSSVHLAGAGSCTVTASQAGDTNYNSAPDVPQSFSIAKATQTITFGALSGKNLGDPDFAVSATASSSLAVTFSATGVCTVAGSTVHLTGAGSCTITASQVGDSNYNPALSVPQSFLIAKGSQTITFGALSAKNFGDPDFTISATASSNLVVSFAATGNCSVAGSNVHVIGAGSCTITASQAGDSNYNPAPGVPQSLTINKALPLVTLSCSSAGFDGNTHACTAAVTGIGNTIVGGTTALTYNSNPAPPANAGTYSVNATFTSSDGNYLNGAGSGSLAIAKAAPNVTVTCPPGVVFDGSVHACTAVASGIGNAIVSGSLVLTYGGGAVPSAGGTYAVNASFTSGDSNYSNGAGIGSLTIAQAGQTITFAVLATKTFGDPDFAVSATASSSLTVGYSASGNCSMTGSTVHLTGVGACTVTASQAGNTNYHPAITVPRSFTINSGGDFTIASTLPTVTMTAGQSVTDRILLTPSPATLTAVTFTCSGLPAKTSCTFAPNQVAAGSAPTNVVMTITTTAATAMGLRGPRVFYAGWLGFSAAGLFGMVVVGVRKKSRKKAVVLATFSLLLMLLMIGCGGGYVGSGTVPGTPSGTSTVTVTGASTNFTHSTTLRLTVN
jgi:hypothetical protein